MSEPVTIFITRKAKPGKEAELEAWMREIRAASSQWPGYVSSRSLESEEGGKPGEFDVVFTFDSAENFNHWVNSPEKKAFYDRLPALIDEQKVRRLSGLEPWLQLSAPNMAPPPKWKMCLLAFFAVYPTIYFVSALAGDFLLGLPIWLRLLCTVPVISIIMTFIAMPLMTRLFRRWLYGDGRLKEKD